MQNEPQIEILNDLILINNDRIEGYKKAAENLKDNNSELLSVFGSLERESRHNVEELTQHIIGMGGEPDTGTTTGGKIYRAWMDVKATFGGDDAKGVLESCEGGEDAAKRAYDSAMKSGELTDVCVPLVSRQQEAQLRSHDKIKSLRDRM